MPTTIYDSSLITQRRRAKAESGSFISRISPWNVQGLNFNNAPPTPIVVDPTKQPNTGYAPALGIYDQSIINQVKNGNMRMYRKGTGGLTIISNGCPCLPPTAAQLAEAGCATVE
jgi:hypothetical protein